MIQQRFYARGKLLLTGEYLVLDGVKSLALPTKFGQYLSVEPRTDGQFFWQSLTVEKKEWFRFTTPQKSIATAQTNDPVAQRLLQILTTAQKMNPYFLSGDDGCTVRTFLEFPKKWGLGTSSTLLYNIACWADVCPFQLAFETFGGSGYDIACAGSDIPLLYKLQNKTHEVTPVFFSPPFKERLFFLYLNQKQNSREGIATYKKAMQKNSDKNTFIKKCDALTEKILNADTLENFEQLITYHEQMIATVIGMPPVKERLFVDYFGAIKSLGAWGGDFVLATGDAHTPQYFHEKGFETVLSYDEMIL